MPTRRPFAVSALALAACIALPAVAAAQAVVGREAPSFQAPDTAGRSVSLADHRGRWVVLEWTNPGCPFVRKHYDSGNLPAQQQQAVAQGVVWLAVNSTAREAGDYLPPAQLQAWLKARGAAPTATLMDVDGQVGRAYGARTTPQMAVIDPQGRLVYSGAIDDRPTANPGDIAGARQHVREALAEAMAGKPVSRPVTQPYGCSVKYGNAG